MGWKDTIRDAEEESSSQSFSDSNSGWRSTITDDEENYAKSNNQADLPDDSRFFLKNVMRTPQRIAKYLNQKYPQLNVKIVDDEVYVGQNGEWRPIDPKGLDWQDVTDVVGDIAFGAVEQVPQAVGAGVGFLSPVPGGTLMGGMIGGGVGSAASEYLQQKIASNWVDGAEEPTDVAMAGITGAMMPAIFGDPAEKTVKYLAQRFGSKKAAELATKSGMDAFNKANRGIPMRLIDGLMPDTTLEAIAGVNKGSMSAYRKYRDFVNNAPWSEVIDKLDEFNRKARTAGKNAYRESAQEFQDFLRAINESHRIDLKPAMKAWKESLGLGDEYLENEYKAELKNVGEEQFERHFRDPTPIKQEVQGDLFDLGPRHGIQVAQKTDEVYDPAVGGFIKRTSKVSDQAGGNVYIFKDPPVTYGYHEQVSPMQAWNLQKSLNAESNAKETLSPKVADRIAGAKKAAAESIDQALDMATDGRSSLMKDSINSARLDRGEILSKFNRRQGTYNTLANFDSNQNSLTREALHRAGLDGDYMQEMADRFKAFNVFKDPKQFPQSAGGTTSTSRTNMIMPVTNEAGRALFDDASAMGRLGKAATGYVGNRVLSADGLKKGMDAARWFDDNIFNTYLNSYVAQPIIKSTLKDTTSSK